MDNLFDLFPEQQWGFGGEWDLPNHEAADVAGLAYDPMLLAADEPLVAPEPEECQLSAPPGEVDDLWGEFEAQAQAQQQPQQQAQAPVPTQHHPDDSACQPASPPPSPLQLSFASLATALAVEAFVRSSPAPLALPAQPAPRVVAATPEQQDAPSSPGSSRSDSPPSSPVSSSPDEAACVPPRRRATPKKRTTGSGQASKPKTNNNNNKSDTNHAKGKRRGTHSKRKRTPFDEGSEDGCHQCVGYNRKKRSRCQNPALMDFIGPRPEYCAEHIDLDPKAIYRKCGVPSGEFSKPCKEVVLNEFHFCHKHFHEKLEGELMGKDGLEKTAALRARAHDICQQIEKEAETARRQGERYLYQRKMKLLPKYKGLLELLCDHEETFQG